MKHAGLWLVVICLYLVAADSINARQQGRKQSTQKKRTRVLPSQAKTDVSTRKCDGDKWEITESMRGNIAPADEGKVILSFGGPAMKYLYLHLRFKETSESIHLKEFYIANKVGDKIGILYAHKGEDKPLLVFEGDWHDLTGLYLVGLNQRCDLSNWGKPPEGSNAVQEDRPTSKATTDWLKEKIGTSAGSPSLTTVGPDPVSGAKTFDNVEFDGCSFRYREKDSVNSQAIDLTIIQNVTVPLKEVDPIRIRVERVGRAYMVVLNAIRGRKVFRTETVTRMHARGLPDENKEKTEMISEVRFQFHDKVLSNQVVKAFQQVVRLCR